MDVIHAALPHPRNTNGVEQATFRLVFARLLEWDLLQAVIPTRNGVRTFLSEMNRSSKGAES